MQNTVYNATSFGKPKLVRKSTTRRSELKYFCWQDVEKTEAYRQETEASTEISLLAIMHNRLN